MSRGTLVERLGHRADARLVIVNCDDLGLHRTVDDAIAHVLRRGLASGATLMVPCPGAAAAAASTAGLPLGIHLTLNSHGTDGLRAVTGVSSVTDAAGVLLTRPEDTWVRASAADVRAECAAQVARAAGWGVDPTHLDSHMGTVLFDDGLATEIVQLAHELELPLRMTGRPGTRGGFGIRISGRRTPARRLADRLGVVAPDHLVQCPMGARTKITRVLRELRPGVTEVYLHPAVDGSGSVGGDDAPPLDDCAARLDDFRFLTEPATLVDLIADAGATTTSYRVLRDLQRSER